MNKKYMAQKFTSPAKNILLLTGSAMWSYASAVQPTGT